MTPTEFASGLADVMDVPMTELATVDRALAKGGLRRIARGRSRPAINLMEGLQIVCAWAGVRKLTDAAEELARQRNFHVDTDGLSDKHLREFQPAFGATLGEISGSSFLEVVRLSARQVGAGNYPPKDLSITIQKSGAVEIDYKRGTTQSSLRIFDLNNQTVFQPRGNVSIKVVIRGSVLKWIYDVTEET